ncbi:MAG: hypothetical protein NT072_13110 [Deltaproteobacteria bacterium]|nr:hypothetical protein [Deltaproteobacteria bacterium]
MTEHGTTAGWGGVKAGAKHAGRSERTLRSWFGKGLKHSRLPSGTVLVKFSDIDSFLEKFAVSESQTDKMIKDILEGL